MFGLGLVDLPLAEAEQMVGIPDVILGYRKSARHCSPPRPAPPRTNFACALVARPVPARRRSAAAGIAWRPAERLIGVPKVCPLSFN
jgi:hypothetical protein